jgi:hypothetical protein
MPLLEQYPPVKYWEIVSRQCCTAVETYLDLWAHKDEQNIVLIEDKEIVYSFGFPKVKFYRDILRLAKQGLVSIKYLKKEKCRFLRIELTGWDDDFGDD